MGKPTEVSVAILGEGDSGKSGLSTRFVSGARPEKYDPTIEDSYRKQVTVDEKLYELELLDTAGTEQFTAMRDLYMKNANCVIICAPVVWSKEMTERSIGELAKQVCDVKDVDSFPGFVVGMGQGFRKDVRWDSKEYLESRGITLEQMTQEDRQWTTEEGAEMAGKYKLPYLELTDENDHDGMETLFKTCVRMYRVDKGELDATIEVGVIGKTTAKVTQTLVQIHSRLKPALTTMTLTTDVLQLMALNFSSASIPWEKSALSDVFPVLLFQFDIPFSDFQTVLWMVLVWIFVGLLPFMPVGDRKCLFQWIETMCPSQDIAEERMAFTDVPLATSDNEGEFTSKKIVADNNGFDVKVIKAVRMIMMIVTWSCARILFLPLFKMMLTTVDCTNTANGLVLDRDPSVICWQGAHLAEGVFCILGMMVLFFIALRLLSVQGLIQLTYKEQHDDYLWFSTKNDSINLKGTSLFSKETLIFDRVMILTKIVVVLVSVLFTNVGLLLVIVFTVFTSALVTALLYRWPFFGDPINTALGTGLFSVLWTNLLALMVVLVNNETQEEGKIVVWIIGMVCVIPLSIVGLHFGQKKLCQDGCWVFC